MAFHLIFLLAITFWASLTSPSLSLTCSSQKLTSAAGKSPYASCLDLPVLDSYLHYSYNASNSSLSVAFVAAPEKSGGWIAWAINPMAGGMIGSQAFIAFRSKSGVPVVKTYNISGYGAINEGKLSFDAWDLRAESIDGGDKLAIFASVKVPAGSEKVNQVWQIGGKVTNGQPEKHSFAPQNLNSKSVLRFSGETASPSPAPSPTAGGGSSAGEKAAGNTGSRKTSVTMRANLVILGLLGIFIF
ncbi:PREDICTED: auxin-induced in root cultures protein 12 [Tarenaya hassleriana]|uniref:auxin-induced in root cultures protein 12 n=1 Tax=Tarenaya hassleriana TaxID=28532 RepID=UPI00053C81B2|nr:PREDICTED: auxin-induced in root cultures protein 12 [Tarenaya hassleriana]